MSPFEPSGGTEPPSQVVAEMMRILQAGRPIEAIKVYRSATKKSLKEAKEVVDRLQAELKKGNVTAAGFTIDLTPAQSGQETTRKGFGCFAVLFVFALGLVGGIFLSFKFPQIVSLLRQLAGF